MSEIKLKKNYYNFLDHITFPIPIRVLQKKRNIEILIALKGTYDTYDTGKLQKNFRKI